MQKSSKNSAEKFMKIFWKAELKKIRMLFSKNKLRNLKKLKEILIKIIILNQNKEKELLACRLHQWRKNARLVECIENSKIIQKFCRNNLNNYLRSKLSNYLGNLAIKYTTYLLKNTAKIDKFNKILRHRPLLDAFDSIDKSAFCNTMKQLLIKVILRQDDYNKQDILRYYLEKWNKKANQLKERDNTLITRIQSALRGYNFRKTFNVGGKIIKKLRIIVEKMILSSNSTNILASVMAKWRKNARLIACEENAKIIQKFCRKIHEDILESRIKKNQNVVFKK